MKADAPIPAAITVGAIYLVASGLVVSFLILLSSVGLPPILAATAFGLLAAGFPIAVLLAVILRPPWTRTAREAAAAALSLYFR